MKYDYHIAGFSVSVETLDRELKMASFAPFAVNNPTGEAQFTVTQTTELHATAPQHCLGSYDWFEGVCSLYKQDDCFVWNRVDTRSGEQEQLFWRTAQPTQFFVCSSLRAHVMEHLMLIAFNYATLSHQALILHSSVVENGGGGYLFLGESGTGKSTHTKLWLTHIPGSTMLNDDAPVVRMVDGKAFVYGTPWSGKGRIFRNVGVPINGIYRLSQAPENRLTTLDTRSAFAAMLHSCLPPIMAVEAHADAAVDILSAIIKATRQFHLACLPNAEAAEISFNQK